MDVSYKRLWKLLIDKDMKKKDLATVAGISQSSVAKMSRSEPISMDVLLKICCALQCDIGDLVEAIPAKEDGIVEEQ
ncbi:MAG: helix-turn-helix transcriptional regulator [Oribacterium sp.]|nr:helix-turn-helix transcriptional regulator [Oribacterium sp.]